MRKTEKNFDTSLRILEVLKVLLNENIKKIDLIEKLKANSKAGVVYTQEAFIKYFNTLEIKVCEGNMLSITSVYSSLPQQQHTQTILGLITSNKVSVLAV